MRTKFIMVGTALLILLFAYAAVSKLMDLDRFRQELNNQVFPRSFTPALSLLLPAIELLIAGLLYFDRSRIYGLASAVVLMLAFTLYTLLVLFHVFARMPCSCGGVLSQLNWPQHSILNLVFLLIALACYVFERKRRQGTKHIHA